MKPTELVSDEEIMAALESAIKHVKSVAASGEKQICPILTIFSRSVPGEAFKPIVIKADNLPQDAQERHDLFHRVGQHTAAVVTPDELPCLAVHITEAWMLLAKLGDNLSVQPSKSKHRIECAVVSVMSIDARSCGSIFELRRRSDQTIVLVERTDIPRRVCHPNDGTILKSNLLATLFDGVQSIK